MLADCPQRKSVTPCKPPWHRSSGLSPGLRKPRTLQWPWPASQEAGCDRNADCHAASLHAPRAGECRQPSCNDSRRSLCCRQKAFTPESIGPTPAPRAGKFDEVACRVRVTHLKRILATRFLIIGKPTPASRPRRHHRVMCQGGSPIRSWIYYRLYRDGKRYATILPITHIID